MRVSSDEAEAIDEAAAAEGVSVSEFLRRAALSATWEPPVDLTLSVNGSARCPHFSVGNVRAVSCGWCGPLRIVRAVA
jgi:hypothetical protein